MQRVWTTIVAHALGTFHVVCHGQRSESFSVLGSTALSTQMGLSTIHELAGHKWYVACLL
jgi:hypothetical protein